jgi:hypothetical protein
MNAVLPKDGGEAPLEWTFNPWRQDTRNAAVGAVVAIAVLGLIAGFGLPPLAIAVMAAIFLATVHPAILPTRCRVDGEGVARRLAFVWSRRPWNGIRGARLGRAGLYVTTSKHPGVLASARGLWLPVPRTLAPGLLDELSRRLAQHGLPQ